MLARSRRRREARARHAAVEAAAARVRAHHIDPGPLAADPADLNAHADRLDTFAAQRAAYAALPGAEPLDPADDFPCLDDATATTGIDAHYVYANAWAFRGIHQRGPAFHLDLGGQGPFLAMLSAITRVVSVDLRPLDMNLDGFVPLPADLTALPLADRSVTSVSCIHVAEHVGLGRYGDPLNPHGTVDTLREAQRVLAPGGTLYLALPVGRRRVQFNAHRIYAPHDAAPLLPQLRLDAFALVDDAGRFHPAADPADAADATYACGLYTFRRPGPGAP